MTHICVSKLTITGPDNGLAPGQHQAIIWTSAGILLIRTLGTNFGEISIKTLTFSFKKMHLKVSSAKRRPFCLSLSVLKRVNRPNHRIDNVLEKFMLSPALWDFSCVQQIVVYIFVYLSMVNLHKLPPVLVMTGTLPYIKMVVVSHLKFLKPEICNCLFWIFHDKHCLGSGLVLNWLWFMSKHILVHIHNWSAKSWCWQMLWSTLVLKLQGS